VIVIVVNIVHNLCNCVCVYIHTRARLTFILFHGGVTLSHSVSGVCIEFLVHILDLSIYYKIKDIKFVASGKKHPFNSSTMSFQSCNR